MTLNENDGSFSTSRGECGDCGADLAPCCGGCACPKRDCCRSTILAVSHALPDNHAADYSEFLFSIAPSE